LKICADENVAPKLTDLIREQLLSSPHALYKVDEFEAEGVDDPIWVRKFADAGGEAIVGGDAAMTKRAAEVVAIAETGLRLIVLDQRWPRAPKNVQISYLFYWWPEIERVLAGAARGKCFKVPWGWPENTDGAIKPIPVDVQGAYKKLKKQNR
jgi:hypothetical protein